MVLMSLVSLRFLPFKSFSFREKFSRSTEAREIRKRENFLSRTTELAICVQAAILHGASVKTRLSESDLEFVVQTVATRRRDHEHIVGLLRDKQDLVEPMLDDPKLAERLLSDQEVFVRVSPYLMFSVLLRRVRRDLESQGFVLERDDRGKRIPVFEAPQTVELLEDPALREYLAEMLCSFVRTNTGLLCWQEHGTWRKRKFSDLDMDDMIALCQLVEQQFKPRLYKRVADIALFLTGIYADHALFAVQRRGREFERRRALLDYERDGRRFYGLAAREAEPPWSTSVYERLAEKFTLAREALNTLNDYYLKPLRTRYFEPPAP